MKSWTNKIIECLNILEEEKEILYERCYKSDLTDREIDILLDLVDFGFTSSLNIEEKLCLDDIKRCRGYMEETIYKFIKNKLSCRNHIFTDKNIKIDTAMNVIRLYKCLRLLDTYNENSVAAIYDSTKENNCIIFLRKEDKNYYDYFSKSKIILNWYKEKLDVVKVY